MTMNYRLQASYMPGAWIILACLLWFGALAVRAADRYVSLSGTNDSVGGYTNWLGAATDIQWAVNKAVAGEKVWITNGTYTLTNQISISKAITVQSVNGRDVTFINGNYQTYTNRCFYVTAAAVIDGLTISNGYAVTNSSGGAAGGGVYLSADGAYVQNCTITRNKASCPTASFDARGGGIYANMLSRVRNCTISYNTVSSQRNGDSATEESGGGGIYAGNTQGTGVIISNCVVFTNVSNWRGGGINMYSPQGLIVNCTIYSNYAGTRGGGANLECGWWGGAPTIRNCTVYKNYAANVGAGITMEGPTPVAEGCLLSENSGSAALQSYNSITRNCTIVKSGADGTFTWGAAYFYNCIIYNTSGTDTTGGGNPPNVIYNNCRWSGGYSLTNGTGNISSAPQFVNYAAGNYRLANNSPCVNKGTNQSWMTGAVDLDGKTRIRYGTVDMGAYERFHEATFYRFH